MVLDTHIWLWWASDLRRLSTPLRSRLRRARDLVISAMSVWEVAMLVEKGRLRFAMDTRLAIDRLLGIDRLRVAPVGETVAREAALLGSSFHGDPCDRIIVATAIELGMPLLTMDERILESGLVTTYS